MRREMRSRIGPIYRIAIWQVPLLLLQAGLGLAHGGISIWSWEFWLLYLIVLLGLVEFCLILVVLGVTYWRFSLWFDRALAAQRSRMLERHRALAGEVLWPSED